MNTFQYCLFPKRGAVIASLRIGARSVLPCDRIRACIFPNPSLAHRLNLPLHARSSLILPLYDPSELVEDPLNPKITHMSYTPSSVPAEASSSKPQVRWANPDALEAEESEEDDDEDVAMAAAQSYPPSGSKSTSATTPTSSGAYSSAFKTSTYPSSTPGASGSGTSGAQPYVPLSYSNSFLSTTPGSFSFIRSEGVGENYTSGGDMGYSAAPAGATGDGDDEFLPAMADDDYSALLSWQKQSKDDLKYVFTLPMSGRAGTDYSLLRAPECLWTACLPSSTTASKPTDGPRFPSKL